MLNSEFVKGDLVTFNAFHGECIPAKVTEVKPDVRYVLEGSGKKSLLSITSGRCIVESKDYIKPPEKFHWS